MYATKYEEDIDVGGEAICLSSYSPSIAEIFNGFENDQHRIGYYAQTMATEYWVLKHKIEADYVGVSGYRRYPIFNPNINFENPVTHIECSEKNLKILSDESNLEFASDILKYYDVIIPKNLEFRISLRDQFLKSGQSIEIWDAFISATSSINLEYKKNIGWFDLPQYSHYFGPAGLTPLGMYKEYANEYFEIVKFILNSISNPFIIIDPASSAKSDRWIGYLAERFYPFFLHMRKASKFQLPVALLCEI